MEEVQPIADCVVVFVPTNIDWDLLAQQKAWLAEIPDTLDPQGFTDGLLGFIDAIQDAYVEALDEATVFPHLQRSEENPMADDSTECCAGGHPATRKVYPNLDYDNGVYVVCDDNDHLPIPVTEISEIGYNPFRGEHKRSWWNQRTDLQHSDGLDAV